LEIIFLKLEILPDAEGEGNYSDTLELIKYYLAIKVSSNAVKNIYKIKNLSIA